VRPVRIALAGVGNSSNSLVQGIVAYGSGAVDASIGLAHPEIGGLFPGDLEVVAAFDVNSRKIGLDVVDAMYADPNCTSQYVPVERLGVVVSPAPRLDGVADHMPEVVGVAEDDATPEDVVSTLAAAETDVVTCQLPGGSLRATQMYADAALEVGAAFVNCCPEPIANDPAYRARFEEAGLPLLGDDIKSQLGTTVLHRTLLQLFARRGVNVTRSYQLNFGGNADFLNMVDRARFTTKQQSKGEAIRSASGRSDGEIELVHPGHIPFLRDDKIAYVRIEGTAFLGMKVELEARLQVEDSPNSAGVAIDAIRVAALQRAAGIGGVEDAACCCFFKRPPNQLPESETEAALARFIAEAQPAAARREW
jgi:myo-inositol-1-phosphate synthase